MSAVLPASAERSPWRTAAPAMGLVLLAVLLLYRGTFEAMVGIWSRSDTFAHAFLVPPIALWLVWRRRRTLAALQPRPDAWMLLPMAGAAAAWLVGDVAGVNALTQFAATAMLVLSVPAVLGRAVGGALLFPLAFLFFMVPFGEFVMPWLMQWTADFTVGALKLFGVPVYREGLQFVIPTGTWSVVEACSGVRYLIASFMVGTLFAYINYRSPLRRVMFGIVSLLVPVAANWLRAVIIVMLGHLSNNALATGVDHLVYGWLFFGVVITVMFFIGARWAEDTADVPPPAAAGSVAAAAPARLWPAVGLCLALLAAAPAWSWRVAHQALAEPVVALPELAGTTAPAGTLPLHQPGFEGAKALAARNYGTPAGDVTVHVAYYRQQTYGHKLVNSNNMLVPSEHSEWNRTASGERRIDVGGVPLALRSAELRNGSVGTSVAARRLQVRQVYWVGGHWTTSDHVAALRGVLGQFNGQGDDAAMLTFYLAGDDTPATQQALDAFVARELPALSTWLAGIQAAR